MAKSRVEKQNKRKAHFETMTKTELRQFIDGCHAAKEFDDMFDAACLVFNSKFR